MATMRAARANFSGEKPELSIQDVEVPTPGAGEVLVKVKSAGVCLSDVHILSGDLKPPYLDGDEVTLGHEIAGVIDSVGEGVDSDREGERIVVRGGYRDDKGRTITQGLDYDGGWAEYTVIPAECAIQIPDTIDFDVACIIPDAVSTPWSAVFHTAEAKPGQAVGVWGVGGLGVHAVKLLRVLGVAPIIAIDPAETPRKRAEEYGADYVLDSSAEDFDEQIDMITDGKGLDLAFDFAGVPPVRKQALGVLGRKGRLIIVGIAGKPIEIPDDMTFQLNRQEVVGHYGSVGSAMQELVDLIGYKRADFSDSITATLPLSEAKQAVHNLENKVGDPIRIVLHPEDD